jgi:hypothetical protein
MSRVAEFQKALASNDSFGALAAVRELIPDGGAGEQEVVIYAFACILEAGSAGLSILFDRFDDDELRKIDGSLERIGATQTLGDLRSLDSVFRQSLANGEDRLEAAEALAEGPETQRIDRASDAQVEEMKEKLLQFCKENVEALAAAG